MFTGIVEEIGIIKHILKSGNTLKLVIQAKLVLMDTNTKVGDSIAINGVCLTITSRNKEEFTADIMPATFYATNLFKLKIGDKVNLERAMLANGRLGGHIVTGHVDTVTKILSIKPQENALIFKMVLPYKLNKYCIPKGSIAIDGTSLTLIEAMNNWFSICLIPHTQKHSILAYKKINELVNVECDILAKQQEKLNLNSTNSKINYHFLEQNGFI